MDKEIKRIHTITIIQKEYTNDTNEITKQNNGFNTLELISVLNHTIISIMNKIKDIYTSTLNRKSTTTKVK